MSISVEEYKRKHKAQSDEFKISVVSRVCTHCANFDISNPIVRQCAAFPDGIPLPIWKGENDHTKPYAGDNGIRFVSIERKKAA